MKKITMLINADDKISHINPEIYGHFSEHLGRCIYNGIYVGEDSSIPNIKGMRKDIVEAFKDIRLPVLRWPGGCFADEYHWKDGIGEKASRKKMVNTNWGGVTEDNSFGTHEFFTFCELVGCEPYLAGNMGSGTVQELSEWIEYITLDGISPMADLRLRFSPAMAYRVYDEFDQTEIQIQKNGDFIVYAEMPIDSWLVGYLLSFGSQVEIIEPEYLREILAAQALEIYKKNKS